MQIQVKSFFFFFLRRHFYKHLLSHIHILLYACVNIVEKLQDLGIDSCCFPMRKKRCCYFFQGSDGCFSSLLRLISISGEWRHSQGGRSISLFPSVEEWGRMMMKHFWTTPELSTHFFSLTLYSRTTFLLMRCELTDQVSHLSVRLSFL